MFEKGLKLAFPVIIGLMALAISYVFIVEINHLNAVFGMIISMIIAIIAGSISSFWLFVLPSFLLIVSKKASYTINRFLCLTQVKSEIMTFNEDNDSTSTSSHISDVVDVTEDLTKTWAKTKEELLSYTQQSVFPYFPEQHHPALLQIVEDFANNNVACNSPIKCTLKETKGLTAGDICHFIGNLVLKFKQADKNKVMNRHSACNFAKNAFPNILTQDVSYIYSHLVQHNDYSKIRNFKKKEL